MRLRVIFTIGFVLGVATLYGGLAAQDQYAKVGEIQVGGADAGTISP